MTQNQGNQLGDRPCVRQSRLYREHVGGNAMKGLLGQDSLAWDTNNQQGAYAGRKVYDHNVDGPQTNQANGTSAPAQAHGHPSQQQPQQQPQQGNQNQGEAPAVGHRRGAGAANRSTYNILSHQEN